jgi:hypothetical protein
MGRKKERQGHDGQEIRTAGNLPDALLVGGDEVIDEDYRVKNKLSGQAFYHFLISFITSLTSIRPNFPLGSAD